MNPITTPLQFGNTYHIVCKKSDLAGESLQALTELKRGKSYYQHELLPDLNDNTDDEFESMIDDFVSANKSDVKDTHVKVKEFGDYLDIRLETPYGTEDRIVDSRLKFAFLALEEWGLSALIPKLEQKLDEIALHNDVEVLDLSDDCITNEMLDDPIIGVSQAVSRKNVEQLKSALSMTSKTPKNTEKLKKQFENAIRRANLNIVLEFINWGIPVGFQNQEKVSVGYTVSNTHTKDRFLYFKDLYTKKPTYSCDDTLGKVLLDSHEFKKIFPLLLDEGNLDINSPLGNLFLLKAAFELQPDDLRAFTSQEDITSQSLNNILFTMLEHIGITYKKTLYDDGYNPRYEENIKTLIELGADKTATNENDKTFYDVYKDFPSSRKRKYKAVKDWLHPKRNPHARGLTGPR